MSRAYITLWSQPQVEVERRSLGDADTLDHTASEQFRARGVEPGDRMYVLATEAGELLLLGRLTVERIVDQAEADRHFGRRVYEAADHLIGAGSPLRLDRVVPESVARSLERQSGKRLKIDPDRYLVDANSLRTTGQITAESAALLDTMLTENIDFETDEPGFDEGGRQLRLHERIERSRDVRESALAQRGSDCEVCGFSFAAIYGSIGEDFAEVHHVRPLATLGKRVRVNPATDVVILCANCHRMVHRADPPFTPAKLAEIVGSRVRDGQEGCNEPVDDDGPGDRRRRRPGSRVEAASIARMPAKTVR